MLLLSGLGAAPGWAQSGCTGLWGITQVSAAASVATQLRRFNTATGQWSPALITLNGWANALAASSSGSLYYVDRDTQNLYSVDLNASTLASTLIGTIPAPPAPAVASNMLGGTSDAAGNLFIYATGSTGGPYSYVTVAQISISTAATLTSWTQLRTTANATPTLAGSGDSFIGRGGRNWIISNTAVPTLHQLNLNPGASFGQTNSPSLSLVGVDSMQVSSVAFDPATDEYYLGGLKGPTSAPFSSVTFKVDLDTGATTLMTQNNTGFLLADMGSCADKPAPPSVNKAFSPTFASTAPATTTVKITLGNINTAPVWLNRNLTDTLPSGLLVAPTPSLQGSCLTAGNTVTATAGASSMVMSEGSRIPAGGCTISFVARAAAANTFLNTIPAGSLSTSAGVNAAQAQAQFQVGVNDFSIVKEQRSATGSFSSTPLSVPAGDTVQFRLTIVNGAGSPSAGTVTYTDTLPVLVTPLLSVTATPSGGGTCTAATAIVGGRTRLTGVRAAAPVGSTCVVVVTADTSTTLALSTFVNTATIAPVAPSADAYTPNNGSTVTLSLVPRTTLTVAKDNGRLYFTPGDTTTYTVTAANLGPAAADGAVLKDPVAAGLSCTQVTCVTTGGASCPSAPLSLAAFQYSGIPIDPFPASSTAKFILNCEVTASGVP